MGGKGQKPAWNLEEKDHWYWHHCWEDGGPGMEEATPLRSNLNNLNQPDGQLMTLMTILMVVKLYNSLFWNCYCESLPLFPSAHASSLPRKPPPMTATDLAFLVAWSSALKSAVWSKQSVNFAVIKQKRVAFYMNPVKENVLTTTEWSYIQFVFSILYFKWLHLDPNLISVSSWYQMENSYIWKRKLLSYIIMWLII